MSKMAKCQKFPRSYFSFTSGVFFLSITLILAVLWQSIFDLIFQAHLQLASSSTQYNMWVKNPLPIYLEVYLFNLTNADEFAKDKTTMPNFQDIGPFLFEESRKKVEVSWSDSGSAVSFNQTKTWRFLPDRSRSFSAQIVNLNPIAMTIAHISRTWNSNLQRHLANSLINLHEPFLVKASAREWLFDGIPDKFLDIFEALRKVTDIPIPYNKFGWFYGRNGSSAFDGTFVIKTGKSGLRDLGAMVSWNSKNVTEHYEGPCSEVRGTTGEVMPPSKSPQPSLVVFASDICSYVTLKYSGPTTYQGLFGIEYVGDGSTFDNGTLYPENLCFYSAEKCLSGSRNVSSCRYGSPAFISFPHFYLADPGYSGKISGMVPEEQKHKFTLKLEPVTGIPVAVKGSFQINFLLKPYEWCDEFRGATEIHIPMLWFKQRAEITQEYALLLKAVLFFYKTGGCIMYGISLLIFITLLSVFLIRNY